MNPAALSAALAGDFENAMVASTPGGIERQEAAGAAHLVESAILPTEIKGATREQLTALGFRFGTEVDDLFVHCDLPSGWTKVGQDSYWTDVLDDKGRKRAAIFYKAAFYDRRAVMRMSARFYVEAFSDGSNNEMCRVDVTDGGAFLKEFGEAPDSDWASKGAIEKQAAAWLDKNYPQWRDPLAHWD